MGTENVKFHGKWSLERIYFKARQNTVNIKKESTSRYICTIGDLITKSDLFQTTDLFTEILKILIYSIVYVAVYY